MDSLIYPNPESHPVIRTTCFGLQILIGRFRMNRKSSPAPIAEKPTYFDSEYRFPCRKTDVNPKIPAPMQVMLSFVQRKIGNILLQIK